LQMRPVSLDTCAATCTGSQNSRRPNEPPLGMQCTVTELSGRLSSAAVDCKVMIGLCNPAQISALPGRTSAIAHSTSSGQAVAAGHSNSPSTVIVPGGESTSGAIAALSCAWIVASDCPRMLPSPHVMSSARQAS